MSLATMAIGPTSLSRSRVRTRFARLRTSSSVKIVRRSGDAENLAVGPRLRRSWIAIAAFTDEQWRAVATELGHPGWLDDPRFDGLSNRRAHEDALDDPISPRAIGGFDGADLMDRLQAAGVPAGLCQTAEDRYERDLQLRHLDWLVELPQTELGTWPVKGFLRTSTAARPTPAGCPAASGPNYGEDTQRVLTSVLGMTAEQVVELRAADVV